MHHGVQLGLTLERGTTRQHLIKHRTQSVDVHRWSHLARFSFRLFRRHIPRRAHRDPALSQAFDVELFGQAKIGYLGRAIGAEQHIRRFEVTMHHLMAMGVLHGDGQRFHQLGALGRGQRLSLKFLRKAAAGTVFQSEAREAVQLVDFVDLHDVGVLQACHGFRFGSEASQAVGIGVGTLQDHLEGHDTVELQMPSLVNDAHAAAAQDTENLEARHNWQGRRRLLQRLWVGLFNTNVVHGGGIIGRPGLVHDAESNHGGTLVIATRTLGRTGHDLERLGHALYSRAIGEECLEFRGKIRVSQQPLVTIRRQPFLVSQKVFGENRIQLSFAINRCIHRQVPPN